MPAPSRSHSTVLGRGKASTHSHRGSVQGCLYAVPCLVLFYNTHRSIDNWTKLNVEISSLSIKSLNRSDTTMNSMFLG